MDTTPAAEAAKRELDAAIVSMMGGVRDPEVGWRAREGLDRMREETRQRIGIVDVAVDSVHDARNQRSSSLTPAWR